MGLSKKTYDNKFYKGHKLELYPTEDQKNIILKFIKVNNYVYNYCLKIEFENLSKNKKYIRFNDLCKLVSNLAKTSKDPYIISLLSNIPITTLRSGIIRANDSFERWFNKELHKPIYKDICNSKRKSYYTRSEKMIIYENKVHIEGIHDKIDLKFNSGFKRHKLSEINPYHASTISVDNTGRFWLSFDTIEQNYIPLFKNDIPVSDPIGIDQNHGNNRFVLSNGDHISSPNTTRIDNHIKSIQSKCSKDIERHKELCANSAKNIQYSNHALKRRKYLNKLLQHRSNITENFIQTFTKSIIMKNPKFIVIEGIDVVNMISKNHYITRYIFHDCFGRFKTVMQYKANWYNIPCIMADSKYPSSKICCKCGYIKQDFRSSTENFNCPKCGNHINRHENAALNLVNYGYSYFALE